MVDFGTQELYVIWSTRPLAAIQRSHYNSITKLSLMHIIQANSAFHPSQVDKWVAGPFNRMCAVAPSGECLRGKSPPDRMLAIPWRRLFLAAFGLNLVVVAVLRDSRVIGCLAAKALAISCNIVLVSKYNRRAETGSEKCTPIGHYKTPAA